MPSEITVYSKPDCQQCMAVVRKLDQLGAPHTKVDVIEDPAAAERLRNLGYGSVPVTVVGEHHKYGYSPEWLKWAVSQAA